MRFENTGEVMLCLVPEGVRSVPVDDVANVAFWRVLRVERVDVWRVERVVATCEMSK